MTPEEHYFENILFDYARRGDIDKALEDPNNTQYLSDDTIESIKTCAIYVINNLCYWNKDNVDKILNL